MTDDWHEWRRQGIGGSDIANVLGIGPWGSPYSVWAEKVGLLPPQEANEAMEAGKWLELAIGPWFADRTGLYVAGEQTWCEHKEHPTHRATVDGFVFESPESTIGDALGLLEIKTTGASPWDEIPAHYQAQAQWSMHVTDMPRTWFAVLHGRRLCVYELERDQADIDVMVELADKFWNDYVLTGIPPAVDGTEATSAALAKVYEHAEPEAVELPNDLFLRWENSKHALRAWQESIAKYENQIKAALGERDTATVNGLPVATWKQQSRKGGLDEKAMAADGIDLSKYRKPDSTFRVLRPVTQKGNQ